MDLREPLYLQIVACAARFAHACLQELDIVRTQAGQVSLYNKLARLDPSGAIYFQRMLEKKSCKRCRLSRQNEPVETAQRLYSVLCSITEDGHASRSHQYLSKIQTQSLC